MMKRALTIVMTSGTLLALSCTVVTPRAGDPIPRCATDGGAGGNGYGPSSGGGGGSSGYGPAGQQPTNPVAVAPPIICEPDSKDECDACEGAKCCQVKSACYYDAVCSCADAALDACIDDHTKDGSDPSECWAAFVKVGPVAQQFVDCLRGSCGAQCKVP
jgi:hypothetical protein